MRTKNERYFTVCESKTMKFKSAIIIILALIVLSFLVFHKVASSKLHRIEAVISVETGQIQLAQSGTATSQNTEPQSVVMLFAEGRPNLLAQPPLRPFPAVRQGEAPPVNVPNAPSDTEYKDSLARIARLGSSLGRGQIADLYRFLGQRDYPGLEGDSLNAVKNQVMDALLRQQVTPEGLGAMFAALALDAGNNEQLRNFSLQHFEPYLKVLSNRGQLNGSAEADAVREAYWRALGESQNSLAGVALLGMERASAFDPAIDRAQVLHTAVRYAADASCDLRTRVSATQVCGVMGDASALPAVRALASSPEQPLTLRLAAIHALGTLGSGEADMKVLQDAGKGVDHYVSKAAARALARLKGQ